MTYRIIYAPRRRRDMEKSYLIAETTDRTVADRAIAQFLEAGDALKLLPERFASYPYARRWRMMPVGSYLVFFQIQGEEVRIGHVRHGARGPFAG
jgi:plasmid stabilization system protein ParE